MRVLADFAMQGRWRAVGSVAALGALGVFVPPVAILSGAVVGLVALRLGIGQALFVAGFGSLFLGAVVFALTGGSPLVGVFAGLAQWLPVAAMGEVLRQSVSWRVTLSVAAVVAGALVLTARLVVPDLESAWVAVGVQMLAPFIEANGTQAEDLEGVLVQVAPFLTGLLAGIFLLSMVLSLVIARYWQALLYNPGAFGTEFRALQLGPGPALAMVGLALAGQLLATPLALELAFILAVLFFLQGLAVMHGLTHARSMNAFWLVGLYVLLVLALPQMFLLITALGAVDGVTRLRERLAAQDKGSGD
ncbi:membrane protein, putative [Thioalkalivibrio nitratireducens DSM 14787]|uniref:Membrane protein, putative n=1 Tax=Thioalkalivibrio nitratireducens (strain DSM 14787 / UNIQEM 213 / ALEN2) TaxID=1255043 RepID=L0E125_THIND|nr:hypothetical protein [Thioalkalivibrio nitratireducens]AGA34895.1 membrane protein, putative [Thioalkalivibrio nitratireducens DSM 14787]